MKVDTEKILALRAKARLTQQALADRADVSVDQFNRIERGRVTPRKTTLYRIADALGVEISAITKEDS